MLAAEREVASGLAIAEWSGSEARRKTYYLSLDKRSWKHGAETVADTLRLT